MIKAHNLEQLAEKKKLQIFMTMLADVQQALKRKHPVDLKKSTRMISSVP